MERVLDKLKSQEAASGWAHTSLAILRAARRFGLAEVIAKSPGWFGDVGASPMAGGVGGGRPADSVWEGLHHSISPVFRVLPPPRIH